MSENFAVRNFDIITAGLHTGQPVKFNVAYTIENLRWPLVAVWRVKIEFEFNGIRGYIIDDLSGRYGSKASKEVTLAGVMPREGLKGPVTFRGAAWPTFLPPIDPMLKTFAVRLHSLPNLDDTVPEPPDDDYKPPVVCIEGQTMCKDHHLWECVQGRWVVNEYWAPECGPSPTPPSPPPGPDPTPPGEGIAGWFERNKKLIIGISAAVIVIAIIVVIAKVQVRSPVKEWPKAPRFQAPVTRR